MGRGVPGSGGREELEPGGQTDSHSLGPPRTGHRGRLSHMAVLKGLGAGLNLTWRARGALGISDWD